MLLYSNAADHHLCSSTSNDGRSWSVEARQGGSSTDQTSALVSGGTQWFAFYKGNESPHMQWSQTRL